MSSSEVAQPKVNIMIPTYNQSEFIGEAVMSALAQSYENLEVIVGDDASTDNTEQVVRAIRDPRLTYIRNENNLGRVGNYRKMLYEYVSGEYVVNLDGDDYYTDPDFISEAIKQILSSDHPPILVVARASTGQGGPVSEIPACTSINGLEVLHQLPRSEFGLMHMAVLYNVKDARAIDFYRSASLSSDWESLYRLLAKGQVAYLDRNVGVWRQHEGNQSACIDIANTLSNLGIWRPVYDHARACGMSGKRAVFKMNQCVAYFALRALVEISKNGNGQLCSLLLKVCTNYPIGFAFLICNPKSMKRLVRSLFGFDRKHSAV